MRVLYGQEMLLGPTIELGMHDISARACYRQGVRTVKNFLLKFRVGVHLGEGDNDRSFDCCSSISPGKQLFFGCLRSFRLIESYMRYFNSAAGIEC